MTDFSKQYFFDEENVLCMKDSMKKLGEKIEALAGSQSTVKHMLLKNEYSKLQVKYNGMALFYHLLILFFFRIYLKTYAYWLETFFFESRCQILISCYHMRNFKITGSNSLKLWTNYARQRVLKTHWLKYVAIILMERKIEWVSLQITQYLFWCELFALPRCHAVVPNDFTMNFPCNPVWCTEDAKKTTIESWSMSKSTKRLHNISKKQPHQQTTSPQWCSSVRGSMTSWKISNHRSECRGSSFTANPVKSGVKTTRWSTLATCCRISARRCWETPFPLNNTDTPGTRIVVARWSTCKILPCLVCEIDFLNNIIFLTTCPETVIFPINT